MIICIAADHGGWERKEMVRVFLESQKSESYTIVDVIPELDNSDNYPEVAQKMADFISKNEENSPQNTCFGIAFCGTGQGICMALNRFPFIRAGISMDPEIVALIRQHNHANVLCLPGRFGTDEEVKQAVSIFLSTPVDSSNRHILRVQQLGNI